MVWLWRGCVAVVSTLLEILAYLMPLEHTILRIVEVFQPFLRFWIADTIGALLLVDVVSGFNPS